MRTCSQRVVVKMEYGCEPDSDYRLVETDMRPDDLYRPVVPKKRISLHCEYCPESYTDKSLHKCYKLEAKMRSQLTLEIKDESKSEISP